MVFKRNYELIIRIRTGHRSLGSGVTFLPRMPPPQWTVLSKISGPCYKATTAIK